MGENMKKLLIGLSFLTLIFTAKPSYAQTRDGSFQAAIGIGAAWNPPMRFDIDMNVEYFLNDTFSFGVDADIFVRGGSSFDLLGFGRYHFELLNHPRFSPYIGAGLGGVFKTARGSKFDIMIPEVGFLWELTPHLYLGPNASFHLITGSNSTWDFQTVGQIAYRF